MSTSRIEFIDNIKAFCLQSIILAHAMSPFFSYSWWYIKFEDPENFFIYYLYKFVVFSFNIGLFFFISGYFIASSAERKSFSDFIKKRVLSVVPPVIFFALFISPFLLFYYHQNKSPSVHNFNEYLANDFFGMGARPKKWNGPVWPEWINLAHLWFIEYWIIFSICFMAINKLLAKIKIYIPSPTHFRVIAFTILLALIYFVMKIWFPSRIWIYPLLGIPLDPSLFIQYPLFFIIGIIAYKNKWQLNFPRINKKACIVAIILCLLDITYNYFMLRNDFWTTSGLTWRSFEGSMLEAILGVGLSIVILKIFKKYFDKPFPFPFLSKHAFGIYFLHLPILVLIQYFFSKQAVISPHSYGAFLLIITSVVLTLISCLLILKFLISIKKFANKYSLVANYFYLKK